MDIKLTDSLKEIRVHFIQSMVTHGKLYLANKLFKKNVKNINILFNTNVSLFINNSVSNCTSFFYIRRYRYGGRSYIMPLAITNGTENFLAIKSLVKNSKKRFKSITENLSVELFLSSMNLGATVKLKRESNLNVISGIPYIRFLKRIKKLDTKNNDYQE